MNDKLSSLFDNELENYEVDETLIHASKKNKKNHWTYYQLIRDVMQKNYYGSDNLTKKIISAIEKEPTQLGGFSSQREITKDKKLSYWPIAASFAALFVVGITALNFSEFKTPETAILAESDVPSDLINDHYASASSNVNFFIQTTYNK